MDISKTNTQIPPLIPFHSDGENNQTRRTLDERTEETRRIKQTMKYPFDKEYLRGKWQ